MPLRLMVLISLLITSILLTGCNGAKELDEVGNVIAIGLDTCDEEGKFLVSYQFAVPQPEGGKADASKSTFTITNKVSTTSEALNRVNSQIEYEPSMAHTKMIILGEELARRGVDAVLTPYMRYREYRGSMFVLVARGRAKEILEKNKPPFNTSMSKYYEEMLASGSYAGYYLRTSLHQYYMRTKNNSGQPYMTLVALNPDSGEGHISTEKVPGEKNNGYEAGNIPRSGGDPLEFAGTAIFANDKMVGMLSTTETRMLAMLIGEYSSGFLSVEDPLDSRYFININLRLGSKPQIKVELVEGRPIIHIKILLEGDISNIGSGINYEQQGYIEQLEAQVSTIYEQQMSNMIRRTQELNSDVAGFGYYLRPAFQTNQEYADYQWNDKYRQAEVFVDIDTKVRRTGLMLRTVVTQ